MHGQKAIRTAQLDHARLFAAPGVATGVHARIAETRFQRDAVAKQIVHHREHRAIVAGDDAAGEDHGVFFAEHELRVLAEGQPLQRRIALGLRTAGEHQQALARNGCRLVCRHHEITRP